nr:immunoglobulin heavy chain junction region [Mus musculus]
CVRHEDRYGNYHYAMDYW